MTNRIGNHLMVGREQSSTLIQKNLDCQRNLYYLIWVVDVTNIPEMAMAGVLIKIRSMQGTFTDAQRQLTDYIANNSDEIPFMSVHKLAERTDVSVASISRFVRTMGYDNFKDFKTQLGKDTLSSFEGIYQEITPKDDDNDIIDKVFAGNIKSLEQTRKILNQVELIKAAGAVARSKRLVFFGIGSSGNIASDAALRFSQLDMQAEAYIDSYQAVNQSLRMKKGDVAFGISHTGRSAITVEALRLAGENGATTIGISNHLKSPLNRVSDIFLCTSFPDSRVKVAALSSRIAQMCLIDALYLLVARRRKVLIDKVERLNRYAERTLRLSANESVIGNLKR